MKIIIATLTGLSWKVDPVDFKRGRLLVAYHNISWNENFYQHRVHTCDWFQISTEFFLDSRGNVLRISVLGNPDYLQRTFPEEKIFLRRICISRADLFLDYSSSCTELKSSGSSEAKIYIIQKLSLYDRGAKKTFFYRYRPLGGLGARGRF